MLAVHIVHQRWGHVSLFMHGHAVFLINIHIIMYVYRLAHGNIRLLLHMDIEWNRLPVDIDEKKGHGL